jgi:hypothetical protein
MRKVTLPYRTTMHHGRAVALFAMAALLVQTLAAAWATVDIAAAPAADFSVICHGEAGTAPTDTPASPDKSCQLCCICCSGSLGFPAVGVPSVLSLAPRATASIAPSRRLFVTSRVEAVRAGRSQAPPSIA